MLNTVGCARRPRQSPGAAGATGGPPISLLRPSQDPIPTTHGGHGGQPDPGGYQDGDDISGLQTQKPWGYLVLSTQTSRRTYVYYHSVPKTLLAGVAAWTCPHIASVMPRGTLGSQRALLRIGNRASAERPATLPGRELRRSLSYYELIEVAFVATFRRPRYLITKRSALREDYAARELDSEFPFVQYAWKTEGVHLMLQLSGHRR